MGFYNSTVRWVKPLVHRVIREVFPLLAVDSHCQIFFNCPSIYTKLCTNLLISKVHWVGINFHTVQKCTVGSTSGCTLYNVHRKHVEASIRSRRCLYILARCAVCCQLCQGICRLSFSACTEEKDRKQGSTV